jgi:hypothetical protein
MTDSVTGKGSNSKFWFSAISAVVIVKFALAGVEIGSMTFGTFDETGAATLIAAFGGVYGWRAATKAKE